MRTRFTQRWSALWPMAMLALLAACGSLRPGALPPGTPIEEARQTNGRPTGEYDLPGGGRRLEYALGSFGKLTYMLDFDAQGRLVKTDQVLDDAHFAAIQRGMTSGEVRMRLGRPAWVFGVAYPERASVWNYRYFEGDCVWFQVSIGGDGTVIDAAHGQDPACDVGGDDRSPSN